MPARSRFTARAHLHIVNLKDDALLILQLRHSGAADDGKSRAHCQPYLRSPEWLPQLS
jgi:hypothetical protein